MRSLYRGRGKLTCPSGEENSGGFESGKNRNSRGRRCVEVKMLSGPTEAKKPIWKGERRE
jgi:hypothetical protein